ncbi:hypothetical protein MM221_05015 [Salipaludibacillus sp. LMS25]|jgi:hypothetical protein|uniref:hypothetical protein n=1 Tax=Salipaludibacillus sp. LMS25 TaxID=2924031 RepID=UPI0020D192F5|nr:hypothetical protein [Salipaludibacillus sp. LMS25]UTR15924.1 hypothetical protein MM221_05015 [Salipaludibacillus sp. LMS25]
MKTWLSLFPFNIKTIKLKQWGFALLVIASLCLFTHYYFTGLPHSLYDAVVIHFGVFSGTSVVTILLMVLPFALLAYYVEFYIDMAINKNLLYTLLRVGHLKWWALSHVITLFSIHVIFLLVHFSVCLGILSVFYTSQQLTLTSWLELDLHTIYPMGRMLFCLFLLQLAGSLSMTLLQVVCFLIFRQSGYGYMIVISMYILTFLLYDANLWIGSFVTPEKYPILSSDSVFSHSTFFIIQLISIVMMCGLSYYLLKRRLN